MAYRKSARRMSRKAGRASRKGGLKRSRRATRKGGLKRGGLSRRVKRGGYDYNGYNCPADGAADCPAL